MLSAQPTTAAKLVFLIVAVACVAMTIYYGFFADTRPAFIFSALYLLGATPMVTGILVTGFPSLGLRLPNTLFVAVDKPAPSPLVQALCVAAASYLLFNTWTVYSKESELMYWDQERIRLEEQLEQLRAELVQ